MNKIQAIWNVQGRFTKAESGCVEYNVASSRSDGDGSLLLDSGKGIAHGHYK